MPTTFNLLNKACDGAEGRGAKETPISGQSFCADKSDSQRPRGRQP